MPCYLKIKPLIFCYLAQHQETRCSEIKIPLPNVGNSLRILNPRVFNNFRPWLAPGFLLLHAYSPCKVVPW